MKSFNEAHTLKEQITFKILLNTMDKMCIYPPLDCVLSNILIFLQKKVFTEKFLTFIRSGKHRSGVMTSARIQPSFRKYNINIGCFDGTRINPRKLLKQRHHCSYIITLSV